ncbi:hypothetical protein ACGFSB_10080 [Streptomyces sp. NPDC048441]
MPKRCTPRGHRWFFAVRDSKLPLKTGPRLSVPAITLNTEKLKGYAD